MTPTSARTPTVAADVLAVYRAAFLRSLAAENRSPRTIQSYGEAVQLLATFLNDRGMPTAPQAITREHLTEWVNDMLSNWKATTAANRYRGAARFFAYSAGEFAYRLTRRGRRGVPRRSQGVHWICRPDAFRPLQAHTHAKPGSTHFQRPVPRSRSSSLTPRPGEARQ